MTHPGEGECDPSRIVRMCCCKRSALERPSGLTGTTLYLGCRWERHALKQRADPLWQE